MSLWDRVKKQFIEVIDWTEESDNILSYKFPVADNEIKNGAQLTVRESQSALFVNQGVPADLFHAGRHNLVTQNFPILSKLQSWKYGFDSPFKADVYFFSLRQKLAQRWGTPQPIAVRDREFGSVMLRMFGSFTYHISDEQTFYKEIAGSRSVYTTDELNQQILSFINSAVAGAFAGSGVPFLDMAANQSQLAGAIKAQLADPVGKLGVSLDAFVVESVSLPPELQEALTQRQQTALVGDIGRFAQYQAAKAIPDAMKASGGLAGMGAQLAAGVGIGNMMGGVFSNMGQSQAPQGAPPAVAAAPTAGTKPCAECAKPIVADAGFCNFCGKPQPAPEQDVFCNKCGNKGTAGSAFCNKCGNKLG